MAKESDDYGDFVLQQTQMITLKIVHGIWGDIRMEKRCQHSPEEISYCSCKFLRVKI